MIERFVASTEASTSQSKLGSMLYEYLNAREVTYLVFTLHPEPSDGVKRLVTLLRLTRTPSLTPIVEMLLPVFDCDTVNEILDVDLDSLAHALELDYVLGFAPLFTDRREPKYQLHLGRAFAQSDQEAAATAEAPNAKPKMLALAAARPLLLSLQRQLGANNKPFRKAFKDKDTFPVALDLELGVLLKQNEELGQWSDGVSAGAVGPLAAHSASQLKMALSVRWSGGTATDTTHIMRKEAMYTLVKTGSANFTQPDLVLSRDLESGNFGERRTICGMIILNSDEE
ncbi:hypothetical protein C6P46_007128 [Rhodotorula mucilaginosa]|uniref:Uncharacterized protein n=1 Tax=Rhodotorula mucilaginosa TaxID=5537 RepID=A0A9P6VVR4_RHOMI|nr:hypothetical protein C6P46_007128 [Rhodotorula mucilaginosa]